MKIINAIVAYVFYFIAPKALMKKAFTGTLLHFNIRLPDQAVNEIIEHIYDIYNKNKKIDKIMKRGGMTVNMERMWVLIESEAFFIKDLFQSTYVNTSGHEIVTNILEKYGYPKT